MIGKNSKSSTTKNENDFKKEQDSLDSYIDNMVDEGILDNECRMTEKAPQITIIKPPLNGNTIANEFQLLHELKPMMNLYMAGFYNQKNLMSVDEALQNLNCFVRKDICFWADSRTLVGAKLMLKLVKMAASITLSETIINVIPNFIKLEIENEGGLTTLTENDQDEINGIEWNVTQTDVAATALIGSQKYVCNQVKEEMLKKINIKQNDNNQYNTEINNQVEVDLVNWINERSRTLQSQNHADNVIVTKIETEISDMLVKMTSESGAIQGKNFGVNLIYAAIIHKCSPGSNWKVGNNMSDGMKKYLEIAAGITWELYKVESHNDASDDVAEKITALFPPLQDKNKIERSAACTAASKIEEYIRNNGNSDFSKYAKTKLLLELKEINKDPSNSPKIFYRCKKVWTTETEPQWLYAAFLKIYLWKIGTRLNRLK
ncbi:hypothetical protein [Colwellia psychrerythraea]|uniref:Uncharacterized protein n=1 Tax=Colwellia psychrerythraea TaxID=28229 RepID=A0A099KB32_COLPS|nr:hypothetical protein [Colwellia psychrerythraea]KGJ87944.1 hypothetical protein GAB14E_4277 [Colwellia psychrerythraea]